MKLRNLTFLSIIIIALFQSCKTTEVYSDFDPNAKFDSYTNFMVLEHLKSMPLKDAPKKWLHQAINSEMSSRGYTETKSPDLLVKVMIKSKTTETTSLQRNNDFYWGSTYYNYGWGIGTGVNKISYDTQTEGTVIIDIIDREKKELIWQGRASGAAKNENSLTEENVQKLIRKIFATYPLAPQK